MDETTETPCDCSACSIRRLLDALIAMPGNMPRSGSGVLIVSRVSGDVLESLDVDMTSIQVVEAPAHRDFGRIEL